jgi:hypothetical protein
MEMTTEFFGKRGGQMDDLTQARLHALLDYDPETGVFTWLVSRGAARAGTVAGTVWKGRSGPYLLIRIDGRSYRAHRLAFLYMTGEWPPDHIDHRDGEGLTNKWKNLREATNAQNGANRRAQVNNTTGCKGVHFNKSVRRYQSCIQVNGKRRHLGYFATAEEAHAAYCKAANHLFGQFARTA